MNFFRALLHPDQEEEEFKERSVVVRAANVLQVGEFQLLQLAYREWHGEDLPEADVSELFKSYMLYNAVPPWARYYARRVLEEYERGQINDTNPVYHRYDYDYGTTMPKGVQQFWSAVIGLVIVVGGSIWFANVAARQSVSLLPPYFEADELRRPDANGLWGRADHVPTSVGVGIDGRER
jgi:hypothetical protein